MATIAEVDKVVAAMFQALVAEKERSGWIYVEEDETDTEKERVQIDGHVDLRKLAVAAIEALRNG
ncbi:hypothetical protein [Microvirga sp. G4-2]|uniref:hypothetical protein n=1 Tax=Microvirga sp. G4-2 TaxID=3434467 RepID=UPI0040442DCB